jgi:hypothetical protein
MFELRCYDLIKSWETVKMKVICSAQQVHGKDQSHQPQVMVAMQMTYKNMIDPVQVRLETHELYLRAFATIDKKMSVLDLHQLR